MGFLRFAVSGNYKRFYGNLKEIGKKEHKWAPAMFCDAAFCALVFGSGLADYLNYKFYNRTFAEKKRYATIRVQDKFYEKVNPSEFKKTFTVKPNFMRKFSKYTGRDFFDPAENDVAGLEKFLAANPVFMQKPIDGLGGHDVTKVNAADIADVNEYYEKLRSERLFADGYIIQHDDINAICAKSVNTIRIMTSVASGKPRVIYAALRVGNGSANVDNFHGGGMGVSIDAETGKLVGNAVDKDLKEFERHPATNLKFDGWQLPFWKEINDTVCEAALVEPRIKVVGWDVAVTPDGPVLVEGNRRPGFDLIQVLSDCGRRDIIDGVLDEIH